MRRRLMTLVVAACLVAGAAACGDDGDGGFLGAADGGGGAEGAIAENGSSGGGGTPGPSSSGDGGYTDSMRSNFMSQCANYPGASESLCGCAWENVTQTVPVEQYQDWERTYDASSSLPNWLTAAVAACS